MEIKELTNKSMWNTWVTQHTTRSFLQSWEWGEFNKTCGYGCIRIGVYEDSDLIAVALVITITAKRGSFMFIPHGPVCVQTDKKKKRLIIREIVSYLKPIAIKTRCSFIRIAPEFIENRETDDVFVSLGFHDAPMHMHSELCWILDLTHPEETLLGNMRKTTRYLVKQNEKSGVVIQKSTNVLDLDLFLKLYNKTQKRQHFVAFDKKYLHDEFSSFIKSKNVTLYLAYHNGVLLSSAFVISFGGGGYYHHGASDFTSSKIPASYILQWEIIKDLKKEGKRIYNFWGIAPANKPRHPWHGLTLFKKGFGGEELQFIKTKDLPLNHWYWLNWIIETLRRIKRHY